MGGYYDIRLCDSSMVTLHRENYAHILAYMHSLHVDYVATFYDKDRQPARAVYARYDARGEMIVKQLIKDVFTNIGALIVVQIFMPIACIVALYDAFIAYRDYLSAFMDITQEQTS